MDWGKIAKIACGVIVDVVNESKKIVNENADQARSASYKADQALEEFFEIDGVKHPKKFDRAYKKYEKAQAKADFCQKCVEIRENWANGHETDED